MIHYSEIIYGKSELAEKRGLVDLEDILLEHQEKYPKMEPRDYYILIYQHCFGVNHYFSNEKSSLNHSLKEFDELTDGEKDADVPFSESIGNGLVRVNLAAKNITRSKLPLLNKLFIATSKEVVHQSYFEEQLAILLKFANEGKLTVDAEATKIMINEYKEKGYPAVYHSENYRETYKPHYRVIDENYINYLPVMQVLERLSEENEKKIIAIDGRCTSGKTTLAKRAQEVFDCNVIHMDDFFLPFKMKTKDRLAQPGGNVHYERIKVEVLDPWKNNFGETIVYHPYNCSINALDLPVATPNKQLNIIEGVYSMHPSLIDYYDYKIFLGVDEDTQLERIKKRGHDKLQMFINQWIPMEEHYFQAEKIEEKSDIVINTSNIF